MAALITAFSMISLLERRCASAEKARDAYRPIVTQYFDAQSGEEAAPLQPSLNIDDLMKIRMLDVSTEETLITPLIAKWLAIGGFILFASCLSWQSRKEKGAKTAEQEATSLYHF